jgi:hypothetical protein
VTFVHPPATRSKSPWQQQDQARNAGGVHAYLVLGVGGMCTMGEADAGYTLDTGRAVRRTVYGIQPYADGYYTAAFPAVTCTILERYRGSYGTVRYRITAVRLSNLTASRYSAINGLCGIGVDLETQMSTPVCWGVRDATIPCSVADDGPASAIWAEEDAMMLSATIEGPCEVDQSQELTCKKSNKMCDPVGAAG